MNKYITLNGKRYTTLAATWAPISTVPSTVRLTLDGALDVTYGPGTIREWQGTMKIAVTPDVGYGGIADFNTCLEARGELVFQDHYADHTYGVHLITSQGVRQKSLVPVWDAASNEWHMDVRLVQGRIIA